MKTKTNKIASTTNKKNQWAVVDSKGKVWAKFRHRQNAIKHANKLHRVFFGKVFFVKLIE